MSFYTNSKKKQEKNVKINVDCDVCFTKEVCVKILETILKYILYQCQQIPIQIDILEREVKKWRENSSQANDDDADDEKNGLTNDENYNGNVNTRELIQHKILQRRENLARKSFERKRQRWLQKVQTVLDSYRTTVEMLQHVVHNHQVKSMIFAIGPSPLTAKNVFIIHLPTSVQGESLLHATTLPSSKLSTSVERKILLSLFKSFTSSKEVASLSSCSFSTSKVWTLIQKEESLAKSFAVDSDKFTLLPKQDFRVSPLAKTFDIFFKEELPTSSNGIISMELTPCIDSKLFYTGDLSSHAYYSSHERTSKVSLCQKFKEIGSKSSSVSTGVEGEIISNLDGEKLNCLNFDSPLYRYPHAFEPVFRKCSSSELVFNECNSSESVFSECSGSEPVFNACSVISENVNTLSKRYNFKSITETRVELKTVSTPSPIRKLSRAFKGVKFSSPIKETLLWYQLENPINGFKENCLAYPS